MDIFLPYAEVLWKKIPASLEAIKDAGFDGAECLLIGRLRSGNRIQKLRAEADKIGLKIRFHQGWSRQTGQRNIYNVILMSLGALIPIGTSLENQLSATDNNPVVVYGNLISESLNTNYVYQTASEHQNGREYAMSFKEFVGAVGNSKVQLVFDTQHILEWFLDIGNVSQLPTEARRIEQLIGPLWRLFNQCVKEIHLCDFNPRLCSTQGRNVFLGDGVFPSAKFCADVRACGWNGVVTPEVAPQHLRSAGKLSLLREKVYELFH